MSDEKPEPNADKPDEESAEDEPKRVEYSDPVSDKEYIELAANNEELKQAVDKATQDDARYFKYVPKLHQTSSTWTRYAGMGIQMCAAMLLPSLLGWYADKEWDTSPAGILIGVGVGLSAGMYTVIKTVSRVEAAEKRRKEEERK